MNRFVVSMEKPSVPTIGCNGQRFEIILFAEGTRCPSKSCSFDWPSPRDMQLLQEGHGTAIKFENLVKKQGIYYRAVNQIWIPPNDYTITFLYRRSLRFCQTSWFFNNIGKNGSILFMEFNRTRRETLLQSCVHYQLTLPALTVSRHFGHALH